MQLNQYSSLLYGKRHQLVLSCDGDAEKNITMQPIINWRKCETRVLLLLLHVCSLLWSAHQSVSR